MSRWKSLNVTVIANAVDGTVVVDSKLPNRPSMVILRVPPTSVGQSLLLRTVPQTGQKNAGVSQTEADDLKLPDQGVGVTECEYRAANAVDFIGRRPGEAALLVVAFLGALGGAWVALDKAARDASGVFWVAAAVFLLAWLGAALSLVIGWSKLKSGKS